MRGLRDNLSIGALLMKDRPSQWTSNRLTCRDVTDRASEYLDDRLVGLTKVLVDMHLVSCTHCRVYMKQIDLISAALKSFPAPYASLLNGLCLRPQFAARYDSPLRTEFVADAVSPDARRSGRTR